MYNYEKIYNQFETIDKWINMPLGFTMFVRMHLENKFGKEFNKELELKHKELYPRRKKINLNNLPENIVQSVKEKWSNIGIAYFDAKIRQHKKLETLLQDLSYKLQIENRKELYQLKISSSHTYNSQGYSANKYAREALNSSEGLLSRNNITFTVANKPYKDEKGRTIWTDYILFAHITKWEFYALQCRDNLTILQWAVNCWKRGVNPKVYNPFLSNEVFDESLRLFANK